MSAFAPCARLLRCLPGLVLVATLSGCSKLSAENYDRLKVGMSFAEVKTVLGDPSRCEDLMTVRVCTWGDERRHIKVSFIADGVVLFNASGLR